MQRVQALGDDLGACVSGRRFARRLWRGRTRSR
jgi:hypothetical protein